MVEVHRFQTATSVGQVAGLSVGEGALTILQHGIPEVPHFLLPLASRLEGRKCLLPWLPGFRDSYLNQEFSLSAATQMLIDFIEQQDEPVDYVGFDWGGGMGWFLEARRARVPIKNLRRVICVACPYLPAACEFIGNDDEQKKRSAYISYFLLPTFGEKIKSQNFAQLKMGLPADFLLNEAELVKAAEAAWSEADYVKPLQSYYSELLRSEDWKVAFNDFKPTASFTLIWPLRDEFFVSRSFEVANGVGVTSIVQHEATHFDHLKADTKLQKIIAEICAV